MFSFLKTKKYWLVGLMFVLFLIPLTSSAQFSIWDLFQPTAAITKVVAGSVAGKAVANVVDQTVAAAISTITSLLFLFFGLFLRLAGMLMNWSIELSVNRMSEFLTIPGIIVAWKVIRDVMNIAFIFGIVYISITTILGVSGAEIKKFLSRLVLAAILVNFSFFFTGVIIDASNILTLQIYQKIINLDIEGTQLINKQAEETAIRNENGELDINENSFAILDFGIAGIFMQHSQIVSIFNTDYGDLSTGSALATALFGSIFIFILTFVFLTVAALLLLRLVVLILLAITSPVAFLGMVFPNMSTHSRKWWKTLFDQAIFAPAYMLMTLVVILVIASPELAPVADSKGLGGAINSGFSTGTMAVVVNYLIVIGLTIGSLIMAKKLASGGGGAISVAAKNTSKYVAGGISYGGRRVFGGLGDVASRSQALQDAANQKRTGVRAFASRYGARTALRLGDKAQKGSFDARATVFGGVLDAGKATGRGGEKKAAEERAKRAAARREVYGKASDEEVANDERVIQQKADNDAAIAAQRSRRTADSGDLDTKETELAEYKELQKNNPTLSENNENIARVEKEIKDLAATMKTSEKADQEAEKKLEKANETKLKEVEKEVRFAAQKDLGGFEAAVQTEKDNTTQMKILSDEMVRLEDSLREARRTGGDTTYLEEQFDAKEKELSELRSKARTDALSGGQRELYKLAGLFGGAVRTAGREGVSIRLSKTKEDMKMARFFTDQLKKTTKEVGGSEDKKDDDSS